MGFFKDILEQPIESLARRPGQGSVEIHNDIASRGHFALPTPEGLACATPHAIPRHRPAGSPTGRQADPRRAASISLQHEQMKPRVSVRGSRIIHGAELPALEQTNGFGESLVHNASGTATGGVGRLNRARMPPHPWREVTTSGAQLLAPLRASVAQNAPSRHGTHAEAKSMLIGAFAPARLKCSFHFTYALPILPVRRMSKGRVLY